MLLLALFLHGLALHAVAQTLVVAAVLAAVALTLVDDAVLGVAARVGEVFAHGALEETLAALAAVHAVVFSRRLVAAYGAYGFWRVDVVR